MAIPAHPQPTPRISSDGPPSGVTPRVTGVDSGQRFESQAPGIVEATTRTAWRGGRDLKTPPGGEETGSLVQSGADFRNLRLVGGEADAPERVVWCSLGVTLSLLSGTAASLDWVARGSTASAGRLVSGAGRTGAANGPGATARPAVMEARGVTAAPAVVSALNALAMLGC